MYKQWVKPRKEEPKEPVISQDLGKISPILMCERLILCNQESDLSRRLLMLEKLKTQVQKASVPYIDLLINKTKNKIASE